jgi:hypothetical protein
MFIFSHDLLFIPIFLNHMFFFFGRNFPFSFFLFFPLTFRFYISLLSLLLRFFGLLSGAYPTTSFCILRLHSTLRYNMKTNLQLKETKIPLVSNLFPFTRDRTSERSRFRHRSRLTLQGC